MKYAQLNPSLTTATELTGDNIQWDSNNFCTAEALVKDGKAAQFRVVELVETPAPAFNSGTQNCSRDGCEKVGNEWRYKWAVTAKPQGQIDYELGQAKAAKNNQINEWRSEANQTYFTHLGKQVACDALSRSDIDAVAGSISLTGAFPAGFPGAWKAMDNSYIVLANINAFKDMYSSMTLQGTVNFGHSQTLKADLAAATTLAQVNALTWEV